MISRRTLMLSPLALAAAPAAAAAPLLEVGRLHETEGRFSALARENEGRRVTFNGYMAPPLMAEAQFFVLTAIPMSVCPFCDAASEWPWDILAVYAKRVIEPAPFYRQIAATGVLRLGAFTDPDLGFVSMVRLEDSAYDLL